MTTTEIVSRTRGVVRRFTSHCSGTTAIEYAVVAALIGGAIVVSVGALGDAVADFYEQVVAAFAG